MRRPGLLKVKTLTASNYYNYAALVKKGCYPARPVRGTSVFSRFKFAWLVFTGKADAITWM